MAVLLAPQSGNPMRCGCESNREGLQVFKALLLSFSSAPLSEDSAPGVNYTARNYSFVPLEAERRGERGGTGISEKLESRTASPASTVSPWAANFTSPPFTSVK